MSAGTKVYPRDHSWYQHRPSSTPGARALHSPSSVDPALAACSNRIMLHDGLGVSLESAPADQLCQRSGCAAARARIETPTPTEDR